MTVKVQSGLPIYTLNYEQVDLALSDDLYMYLQPPFPHLDSTPTHIPSFTVTPSYPAL